MQSPEGFAVGELGLEQRANTDLHIPTLCGIRDPPGKFFVHVFS